MIKMKIDLYYIEQKNGTNHDGPAWIGFIQKSKTGKTIYFNNQAFWIIRSNPCHSFR